MDHDQAVGSLDAFVDGEGGARFTAAIEAHVDGCAICQERIEEIELQRARTRDEATRHPAPAALRAGIVGAIDRESVHGAWQRRVSPWFGAAMLAASVLVFVASGVRYAGRPASVAALDDDAVSAHVRALISDGLVAVASSDKHTVKPWFAGRLDFSPPVGDFSTQGYPLIGGRLDYLDHRPVAAVVYRHDAHLISVFSAPAASPASATPTFRRDSLRGYQVVRWDEGTLRYWAVSDVEIGQLEQLARLVAAAAADPAAIDH